MKTLLKIIAAAAAIAFTPVAAGAQSAAPAAQSKQDLAREAAAPLSDTISAQSQAAPAQPQAISPVETPSEEPSDANVAASTQTATAFPRAVPKIGVGQPDGRMNLQDQYTEIGQDAAWFHNVLLLPVITLISLFVLALMASGLEGQRFACSGYLPREANERAQRIRELEQRSRREKQTQIFIETPYRNEALLGALLETCKAQTRL